LEGLPQEAMLLQLGVSRYLEIVDLSQVLLLEVLLKQGVLWVALVCLGLEEEVYLAEYHLALEVERVLEASILVDPSLEQDVFPQEMKECFHMTYQP